MTESSESPLSGFWQPTHLAGFYYGPNSVKNHLIGALPSKTSKAIIVTGKSLATKTSLISDIEKLLGERHIKTFSNIGEHAPEKDIEEAVNLVKDDNSIDTIISVGGGSPIDSCKAINYKYHEHSDKWLYHITIPTTLSAAECTMNAGLTGADGVKKSVVARELAVRVIIYDSKFALETPPHLWMSTGMRAFDHAVELQYYPTATAICKLNAVQAASTLYQELPKYKANPKDEDTITRLQLAAFASLGFLGTNMKGSLGLSHTLGYALGSPYKIPHGVTSCLTLGHVVKLKAKQGIEVAKQIARLCPSVRVIEGKDDIESAERVGDAILKLVSDLGLKTTLTEKGVGRDQIDIIVRRATGAKEGDDIDSDPQRSAVKELVTGLY